MKCYTLIQTAFVLIFGVKGSLPRGNSPCPRRLIDEESIPDYKITASSQADDEHSPINAKLDTDKTSKWCPHPSTFDNDPYIKVELDKLRPISGIRIVGQMNSEENTVRYTVAYSTDDVSWTFVTTRNVKQGFTSDQQLRSFTDEKSEKRRIDQARKQDRTEQSMGGQGGVLYIQLSSIAGLKCHCNEFNGDVQENRYNDIEINEGIDARFLKIFPTAWSIRPCLRFDILGCEANPSGEKSAIYVHPGLSYALNFLSDMEILVDGTAGFIRQHFASIRLRAGSSFKMPVNGNVGKPSIVTIRPTSSSINIEITKVEIEDESSGDVYAFEFNCTINNDASSFSIGHEKQGNWYAVVKTGDGDGEQTMSKVNITIHDDEGHTHKQQLVGTFEKGALDITLFKAELYKPMMIEVEMGLIKEDKWKLMYIELRDRNTHIAYRFTCNCLIYDTRITLSSTSTTTDQSPTSQGLAETTLSSSTVSVHEETTSTPIIHTSTPIETTMALIPITSTVLPPKLIKTNVVTTPSARNVLTTQPTFEISELNIHDVVERYLQWADTTEDAISILTNGQYIAAQLNELEIQNRTQYIVEFYPERWPEGLLDVNGDCNNSYSFNQLLENTLQRLKDDVLDDIIEALGKISYAMMNALKKDFPQNLRSIEIAANAFAVVTNRSDATSNVTLNNVVNAANFVSETMVDLISKEGGKDFSNTTLLQTTQSLVRLANSLINVLSPENLSELYITLVSTDMETSRMYVDYFALVHVNKSYDLMECSKITPDERSSIFKLQSKVHYLQFKEKQNLANRYMKTILSVLQRLLDNIAKKLSCFRYCVLADTNDISVVTIRTPAVDLSTQFLKIGGVEVMDISSTNKINGDVIVVATTFQRNPLILGIGVKSSLLTSKVVKVVLMDTLASHLPINLITVSFPVTEDISGTFYPRFTTGDASRCIYHTFMYRHTDDAICMYVSLIGYSWIEAYEVYIRYGQYPTHLRYDISTTMLPLNNWTTCVRPFFPTGVVYVCLRPRLHSEVNNSSSDVIDASEPSLAPYNLSLISSSCQLYDSKNDVWKNKDECKMTLIASQNRLKCSCRDLQEKEVVIGNTFYVPANTIAFSTVFLKFSPRDQAPVLSVIVAILLIYTLLCMWGRIQDKQDIIKWGATPLVDNFTDDTYYYLITVYTGMRIGAGTKSSVEFVAVGSEDDTCIRQLSDGVRKEFSRGSIMHFIMATPHPLGDLDYIYLWFKQQDTEVVDPWYLHRIDVQDLQIQRRYVMYCNRWLSDSPDAVDAVLPVCGQEDVLTFKNLFFNNISEHLAENHMFFSIFYRPNSSNFTRVQRITCLLVFVVMTMIGNAIYFTPADEYVDPEQITLGPMILSLQVIYVSLITAIISTVTTFLVSALFRKSKPRNRKHNINKSSLEYIVPGVKETFERLLRRSRKLEQHLITKGVIHTYGTTFPFWFVYVAWFLSLSGTLVALFFLFLFSMEWGRHKSEMWLTQFFLSFGETCIVLDQLKVPIIAAMLAMIFIPFHQFRPSALTRHLVLQQYRQKYSEHSGQRNRKPGPKIDRHVLKNVLQEQKNRQDLFKTSRDFLLICVFLWIISAISYENRDSRSFPIHDNIRKNIVNQTNKINFNKVKTVTEFDEWLTQVLFPTLFPETGDYGEELHWRWRQYISDFCSYRIGPPRIRQLRVEKGIATYPYIGEVQYYLPYQILDETTTNKCKGWLDLPCDLEEETYSFSTDAWKYTSATDIWGTPTSGIYNMYGGGGFIAEFDTNWFMTKNIWNELKKNRWIDRSSRAVFLEFTIYSPNVNLFTYASFLAELPETGGVITSYNLSPIRIFHHHGENGVNLLVCEVLFVIMVTMFFIYIVLKLYYQRLGYFSTFSRMVDFLILVTCVANIVLYFFRFFIALETMKLFKKQPESFLNFQHLVVIDNMFILFISVLQALAMIRLCCATGFLKNVQKMFLAFNRCLRNLQFFTGIFWYFLIGYAFLGTLIFGKSLRAYMDILSALESLIIYLLGQFKLNKVDITDYLLAQLYFFTFVLTQSLVLLSMYVATLCEGLTSVQTDDVEQHSLGLFEVVYDWFRGLNGHKTKNHHEKAKLETSRMMLQDLRDFCEDQILQIRSHTPAMTGKKMDNRRH